MALIKFQCKAYVRPSGMHSYRYVRVRISLYQYILHKKVSYYLFTLQQYYTLISLVTSVMLQRLRLGKFPISLILMIVTPLMFISDQRLRVNTVKIVYPCHLLSTLNSPQVTNSTFYNFLQNLKLCH